MAAPTQLPDRVSEITVRRLSHYARCLRMAMEQGVDTVTSAHLARRCGISSSAVRKDLALFGDFGKQGSGYDTGSLLANIERILGTDPPPPVVVVGVGNIGRALLLSGIDGTGGRYEYAAAFDEDPDIAGGEVGGVQVHPMERLPDVLADLGRCIAVVAVPPGSGQSVVDRLVACGCTSLLSFTLEPLRLPEGAELRYVEISTELDLLAHRAGVRDGGPG